MYRDRQAIATKGANPMITECATHDAPVVEIAINAVPARLLEEDIPLVQPHLVAVLEEIDSAIKILEGLDLVQAEFHHVGVVLFACGECRGYLSINSTH
jgi:hypothetical protein